jgi:hypothetical protein
LDNEWSYSPVNVFSAYEKSIYNVKVRLKKIYFSPGGVYFCQKWFFKAGIGHFSTFPFFVQVRKSKARLFKIYFLKETERQGDEEKKGFSSWNYFSLFLKIFCIKIQKKITYSYWREGTINWERKKIWNFAQVERGEGDRISFKGSTCFTFENMTQTHFRLKETK